MGSRKPLAYVQMLAGGPEQFVTLPSQGKTSFKPGSRVKFYTAEDLAAAKRGLPADRVRFRELSRLLDEPARVVTMPVEPVAVEAVPASDAKVEPESVESPRRRR